MNFEVGSLYQYVLNSPERLLMATKSEKEGESKSRKVKQL